VSLARPRGTVNRESAARPDAGRVGAGHAAGRASAEAGGSLAAAASQADRQPANVDGRGVRSGRRNRAMRLNGCAVSRWGTR
jgi:hypothetical protein